jgi:hypothetical protein
MAAHARAGSPFQTFDIIRIPNGRRHRCFSVSGSQIGAGPVWPAQDGKVVMIAAHYCATIAKGAIF